MYSTLWHDVNYSFVMHSCVCYFTREISNSSGGTVLINILKPVGKLHEYIDKGSLNFFDRVLWTEYLVNDMQCMFFIVTVKCA